MTRQVLYVAAPLAPSEEEIVIAAEGGPVATREDAIRCATSANVGRAMRWLSWLRRSFPETTFIAPWIAAVLSGEDDADPAQREAGLVDDCAVVERCDGIVLCGPRISSEMRREMEHAQRITARCGSDFWPGDHIYDLTPMTGLGFVPEQGQRPCSDTGVSFRPIPWKEWAEEFRVK